MSAFFFSLELGADVEAEMNTCFRFVHIRIPTGTSQCSAKTTYERKLYVMVCGK